MNKTIIYQLLPRLFFKQIGQQRPFGTIEENGCGKFNDITADILGRIKELGVTHIWYTGIIRHATTTDYTANGLPCQHPAIVKGKAGSPYAIADYYDVDPDLAVDVGRRKEEFAALIERTHRAKLKVIIDLVPNHVARQYQSVCRPLDEPDLGENDDKQIAFSPENNFYYLPGETFRPTFDIGTYGETPARATGNDRFDAHPGEEDWYETIKLNYGCPPLCTQLQAQHDHLPDTFHKMEHILRHWAGMGVDGFRCDMVHMVPLAFWQWCIPRLKASHPCLIFIGENYQQELYRPLIGAGFDLLYDKTGMYDTLISVGKGETSTHQITRCWQQTDDIADNMLFFLENHDEQRLASQQLLGNAFKAISMLVVAACLRREPFMIYFGQEVGEDAAQAEGFSGNDGKTTIFDYWHLSSASNAYFNRRRLKKKQRQLLDIYKNILQTAAKQKAIAQGRMFDLMYVNQHISRQYAFFRQYKSELLLCIANFAGTDTDVNLHLPQHAFDYLGIDDGTYKATDLLNGGQHSFTLKADDELQIPVRGYEACIFKMSVPQKQ